MRKCRQCGAEDIELYDGYCEDCTCADCGVLISKGMCTCEECDAKHLASLEEDD